jgi:hypothetical protein
MISACLRKIRCAAKPVQLANNCSDWKDLNSKFLPDGLSRLRVHRKKGPGFLRYTRPAVRALSISGSTIAMAMAA